MKDLNHIISAGESIKSWFQHFYLVWKSVIWKIISSFKKFSIHVGKLNAIRKSINLKTIFNTLDIGYARSYDYERAWRLRSYIDQRLGKPFESDVYALKEEGEIKGKEN